MRIGNKQESHRYRQPFLEKPRGNWVMYIGSIRHVNYKSSLSMEFAQRGAKGHIPSRSCYKSKYLNFSAQIIFEIKILIKTFFNISICFITIIFNIFLCTILTYGKNVNYNNNLISKIFKRNLINK